MLIYLDANVVQYCADYGDFIFGQSERCENVNHNLQKELAALRKLVELEQLGDWTFAVPTHLLEELGAGKPTEEQNETYKVLHEGWRDSAWLEDSRQTEDMIRKIERSLAVLKLKHASDRRHLAEAVALNASWFLSNDKEILRKTNGAVQGVRVCRPSGCLQDISIGLFLR
jgi:hypothetical protein